MKDLKVFKVPDRPLKIVKDEPRPGVWVLTVELTDAERESLSVDDSKANVRLKAKEEKGAIPA